MSNTNNEQIAALLQQLAQANKQNQNQQASGFVDQPQFQGLAGVDKGNMNLLQGTALSQTKQGLGLTSFLPKTNAILQPNPALQQPMYKEIKDMLQFQAPSNGTQQQQDVNTNENMLQNAMANNTAVANQSSPRVNVQPTQEKLIQQQPLQITEAFQGQQPVFNQKIGPMSLQIDPAPAGGFSAFKSIGVNEGLQKRQFSNTLLFGQTLSKGIKPLDDKLPNQLPIKQVVFSDASKTQGLMNPQDNSKDDQKISQIGQNCPTKVILTAKQEPQAPPQAKKIYIDQLAQLIEKQRMLRKTTDKGQSQVLNENLTQQSVFQPQPQTFQNDAGQMITQAPAQQQPEGQMSAAATFAAPSIPVSNPLVDQLGTNPVPPAAAQGLKPQVASGQSKQTTEKFIDLMVQIQTLQQKSNQNKQIIQNQCQQEPVSKNQQLSELAQALNLPNVDGNLLSQLLKPEEQPEQPQPQPPLPPVVNTNTQQQQYAAEISSLLELLHGSQQEGREQQQFEPPKVVPQQPQPPAALKSHNMLGNTLNGLQMPTQQNQAYTNDLDKVSQILLQQQSNIGLGGLQQQANHTQNQNPLQKMQFAVNNLENQNNALSMNPMNAPPMDFKATTAQPAKEASSSNLNADALLSVLGLLNTKNSNQMQSQQLQQALGDLLTAQTQQQQMQQQIQDQNQSLISKLLQNEYNNSTKPFTQNEQGHNENEKIIEALLGGNQLNFQQETPLTNQFANKGLYAGINGLDQQSLLTNQNFLNLGNTGAIQQVQQVPQSGFNGQNPQRDLLGNQLNCAPAHPTKPNLQFNCPHHDKKQYAKNMCHNCYHRKGKSKMANKCEHIYRSHYSNGLCQNCYLAQYYQKRKAKMLEKQTGERPAAEGAGGSPRPGEDDEGAANGAGWRDGKDGLNDLDAQDAAKKWTEEGQELQNAAAVSQQINNEVRQLQGNEDNNDLGYKRQKLIEN